MPDLKKPAEPVTTGLESNASADDRRLIQTSPIEMGEQSGSAIWHQSLNRLPHGVAILDAASSKTLWINEAFASLLKDGLGTSGVIDRTPAEYLPGLTSGMWEDALGALPDSELAIQKAAPERLRFVHSSTRNIAYWDWSVLSIETGRTHEHLLLTVQVVSEHVLNERVLASTGRAADRARRRAEVLVRLTQVVNASLTTPQLLRAITDQAAAFFDSPHAAVFLVNSHDYTLSIGHAMGLQSEPAGNKSLTLNNTLAGRAISKRQTQMITNLAGHTFETPTLATAEKPVGIISSPIWQDGHDYGVIEVYFSEPINLPDGALSILGAFADQTAIALHKADLYEQIAAQRRQLQSIVENAPVSIIYFDVDGYALSVNQAAADKYDYSVEAMIGHSYREFLTDVPQGLFEKVRAGAPFHASHHVHDSPTHGQMVCDLTIRPVRDESGEVAGVLVLSFQVTELVHARQEADQARQAAEIALQQLQSTQSQMVQMEKMRAIGELASGVAHDFNNALMAILGYTELAEESLDSREDLVEQLAIIRQAAEDASTTVKRLQRFAKQPVATNGEPTDLNAIVRDVVSMTRPRWRDAAHKEGRVYDVRMDLRPVPLIFAEPSGLREVLINIIYNALNAMPAGGTLTLSTRPYDGNRVEISVQDTGVGMTPEVTARIFDPFFTTRGVEGMGLGLAVSWTIIQRHGGTIDVDTKPGRGTRFMLRFPVGDDKRGHAELRQPAPNSQRHAPGDRALIVDDEPFVASVLTTILARHGYRVTAVHSAQEALGRLSEDGNDPYQFVLTDHGMPGMTGLQLVAELKQQRPELPILLLTGWGESLLQTHIAEVLPDAVLGKPINQTDLLDAIARVRRERALSGAAKSDETA